MSKSKASKMNGYRSMVSRQKNDVFKFKPKKKKKYDPNIVRTKSASLMRNI